MAMIVDTPSRYRLGKKIGSGSFGDLYLAYDTQAREEVAIKLEKIGEHHQYLRHELEVYRRFGDSFRSGIPDIKWYGVLHGLNALVMELLGPSLEDLFNYCHRIFSLKTVLLIAVQVLCRLASLHTCGYVHRDVKPENFVIGRGQRKSQVYMIDFGLAKHYRDPATHEHYGFISGKEKMAGTIRYASLNNHRGLEQTRRDDLVALGYMLIYFLKGRLPWQGVMAKTTQHKHEEIHRLKQSIPVEALCQGLPVEFAIFLDYANGLRYDAKPDYPWLHTLFRNLYHRQSFTLDYRYDWVPPPVYRSLWPPILRPLRITPPHRRGPVMNNREKERNQYDQNGKLIRSRWFTTRCPHLQKVRNLAHQILPPRDDEKNIYQI
ncbi:hypothetical protein MJO28_007303 [Puccinia striiformis f. sp. tritici]|uniref:Uncharacterized protein n=1 Tax=Puccinia striiformis f. sp. tritici TaxID=168172 RepID=A0ACC0EDN5_9BASI|nr:hypothetical protein MJO28_007303 [Puccinia striiformis f. sp. tritici]